MTEQTVIKLPGEAYSDRIRARFWLMGENESYLGIGRITLLEKIHVLGSMNQAAKEMGMSYKKAWKLIEELNGMFDEPLVIKEQGGKAGGGTALTARGIKALEQFRTLEQKLIFFLQQESQSIFNE